MTGDRLRLLGIALVGSGSMLAVGTLGPGPVDAGAGTLIGGIVLVIIGMGWITYAGLRRTDRWSPGRPEHGVVVPAPGEELVVAQQPTPWRYRAFQWVNTIFGNGDGTTATDGGDTPAVRGHEWVSDGVDTVAERIEPSSSEPADRRYNTRHWAGMSGAALILLGLAVLTDTGSLVLMAAICLVFAGYAWSATTPLPAHEDRDAAGLQLTRSMDEHPAPDAEVEILVTLENTSDTLLADVRIVDGVPRRLNVVDGTPRHADVLSPGASTSFSYRVRATPGEHTWEPATVVVADPSGSIEQALSLESPHTLSCNGGPSSRAIANPPLASLATPYPGRIETGEGGEGIEFHSRRDYQPTDPRNRIDWKHVAKTGEFATLEHHEEHLARVMLVIDSRHRSYVAAEPTATHAVQWSVEAARTMFETLLDAGDQVGVTTYGPWEECWFAPHSGSQHRARGQALFEGHDAFSLEPPEHSLYEWLPPDGEERVRQKRVAKLHHRLPPETQLVFFSPCVDDHVPAIVKELHAYGHPVTVISPDPTIDGTEARAARRDRLADLRNRGIRLLDWSTDESFEAAFARTVRRWNQ